VGSKLTEQSPRPAGERARVRGAVERARSLRRAQTDAEHQFWSKLRDRQLLAARFRRQHPIGRYIVAFCCPERGLVVELDGSQHTERMEADRRRSAFLAGQGYRVLRFWDTDVLTSMDAVLEAIAKALADPHPGRSAELTTKPSPCKGERGLRGARAPAWGSQTQQSRRAVGAISGS
jgi:very-short-patch-repair endonuclease